MKNGGLEPVVVSFNPDVGALDVGVWIEHCEVLDCEFPEVSGSIECCCQARVDGCVNGKGEIELGMDCQDEVWGCTVFASSVSVREGLF